jgi:chemotaxis protein CheZ
VDETRLDLAHEFLEALEKDDEDQADEVLALIAAERESRLFEEIGKLTRQLHDALSNVHLDSQIAGITENDIPDAKERLNFVIEKTEDSANRTMDAIDEIMPISDDIRTRSGQLKEDWSRFQRREMDVKEFKKMGNELMEFLVELDQSTNQIHGGLNNILLAQDFQDITGQVIRKVIGLVQDVENSLVGLIRATGVQAAPKKQVAGVEAEGPQINQDKNPDVLNDQDDVDDLLSSLGF